MADKRNLYEVLGVPRTATTEQIKRRYRQLVRQYHPDVAKDKTAAQTAFIEISEAYQTLTNDDRRVIYDSLLDAEARRARVEQQQKQRPQTRWTPPRPEPRVSQQQTRRRTTIAQEIEQLLREAEAAFIRGQFRSAMSLCNGVIALSPRHVRAHMILGDIYRIQGRNDEAIAMYSVVVQLDPRNLEAQSKLRALMRTRPDAGLVDTPVERQNLLKMGLNLIGLSIAGFLLLFMALSPEDPLPWFEQNLRFVDTWSGMLIAVLLIDGGLVGFLLSVNEKVGRIDDELVFQSVRAPGHQPIVYPIGLILLLFNFFSFYLAAGMYLLVGYVQESLSKSVVRACATTFLLVLFAAIMYTPGRAQVLAFGGNLAFPAVLIGWAIGDMFRPGW